MPFDVRGIYDEELEVFGSKGVINPDKRVLLIGLGGTGTDALLVAKDMMQKRFRMEDGRLPENIEFLAIDTDRNILSKRVETARIDSNDLVLLSDPMIQKNFDNKSQLPEYIRDWLNPDLPTPVIAGEVGAGGIRQVGRYLLIQNYADVIAKIQYRLHKIMINAPQGSMIDIIILSGMSGGTGGGTFIDMGYMVRKACQEMAIRDMQKQITAYLFMPDAHEFNPNVPDRMKEYIRINGYAAMKELDYFMSIPEKKTAGGNKAERTYKFKQKYGYNKEIESDEAPFDVVYLIAGQADVLHPMPYAYDYAISMSANSIVNFIAGSTAVGHTAMPMGVAATDINGAPTKALKADFVRDDGKAQLGVYKYRIMGLSVATLPMKGITEYVAGLFLQKIDVLKKQLPTAQDYDKFYKTIRLNVVEPNIMSRVGAPDPRFKGSDLAYNPVNESAMMQDLNRYVKMATSNIPGYVEMEIAQLENKIMNEINNYFSDINKGPFFANRIMADGQMGIIARLIKIAQQLNMRASGCAQEEQMLKYSASAKKAEVENAHFGRANKYQDYINLRVAQAEQKVRGEICKALAQRINDTQSLGRNASLVETLKEKNKGVFDTYLRILSPLAERFANGGMVMVNRAGKSFFMWDIVRLNDIWPLIDNVIHQNHIRDIDMEALLSDMIRNPEEWCDYKKTMYKFGEFLSQRFDDVFSVSMDEYLATIPPQYLEQMVKKLDQSAEEHFPQSIAAGISACNIFDRVTVPATAPEMKDTVVTYLHGKGITALPQVSILGERVSWTRVSIGVPMFLYAYLPKYEQAYKNAPIEMKIGLHLYENEGVCGVDYPALLPEMFYNDNFTNDAEEKRCAKMAALFDKAEALGLVEYARYAAAMKVSHEDWCRKKAEAALKKYKIDINDIYGSIKTTRQIAGCRAEISEIFYKMDWLTDVSFIYLPDTEEQPNHEDTVWYAKESFCRMPEAKKPVEEEIAKIERVNDIIAKLDKVRTEISEEKEYYMTFIYAFVFDVIKKDGMKYVYMDGEDEFEVANTFRNPMWRWDAFNTFNASLREVESENIKAKLHSLGAGDEEFYRAHDVLNDISTSVTGAERAAMEQLSRDDPRYESVNEFYKKLKVFIHVELEERSWDDND